MHKVAFFLTFTSLYLVSGLPSVFARSGNAPETLSRVPNDSVIVLSVDGAKVIAKSGILQSNCWKPLLDRMEKNGSPIRSWFTDSNISGISWEDPVQFFIRLIEGERPYPQFGAILRTSSVAKADETVSTIAEFLGLRPSKNNPKVYQRATQPFAIGRAGEFCFIIGTLFFPQQMPIPPPENDLSAFIASLSKASLPEPMPSSLSNHAKHFADLSLYIEGIGVSRMMENLSGNTLLGSIFPLFDPLLPILLAFSYDQIQALSPSRHAITPSISRRINLKFTPLKWSADYLETPPWLPASVYLKSVFNPFLPMALIRHSSSYPAIIWEQIRICQDLI